MAYDAFQGWLRDVCLVAFQDINEYLLQSGMESVCLLLSKTLICVCIFVLENEIRFKTEVGFGFAFEMFVCIVV